MEQPNTSREQGASQVGARSSATFCVGDDLNGVQDLAELLASNADDREVCDWLNGAPVGEARTFGGGAFAEFTLRRVS